MLPDLSRPFYEKRGRFYSQFNFIMWRSWLGLGKGEEGDRTHKTPCSRAGWACRVDLCQGPASWELHGHSPPPSSTDFAFKRKVPSALCEPSWRWGVCVHACVWAHMCVPRSAHCRGMGVAGVRTDPERARQSGQMPSEDPLCRETRGFKGRRPGPACGGHVWGALCLGMGSPDSGLPGRLPGTGPSCPQGLVSGGCVMEGEGGSRLQFRGALGFPALVLPPCTHYLFNHLFMILEEPREKREWDGGAGQSHPVVPPHP